MKKIIFFLLLLTIMSGSAFAVERAEVNEQWVVRRDGVIVENVEKTTSMMIPTGDSGLSAEENNRLIKQLRKDLLVGDKKKGTKGVLPELKEVVESYGATFDKVASNLDKITTATEGNSRATEVVDKNVRQMYGFVATKAGINSIGDQNVNNTILIIILMCIGFVVVIAMLLRSKNI